MARVTPVFVFLLVILMATGCSRPAASPDTREPAKSEESDVTGLENGLPVRALETPEKAEAAGSTPQQKADPDAQAPRQGGGTPEQAPAPPPEAPVPSPAAGAGDASGEQSKSPVSLQFSELYAGGGARGLVFTDKLKSLAGRQVVMSGYMAPPLKPSLSFFVLTRQPMAICPFCSTDADWPADIVLVLLAGGRSEEG